MFKNNPEYTQFDEKGIPTHDKEGKPLSHGKIKQATKDYEKTREATQCLEREKG